MMTARMRIVPGVSVRWNDADWVVLDYTGLDTVVIRSVSSGETAACPASQLAPSHTPAPHSSRRDLQSISDEDWQIAWDRFEYIKPLLDKPSHYRTVAEVTAVAQAAGKNLVTIYRWINKYEQDGLLSSLAPRQRKDKGTTKLLPEVEALVQRVIEAEYLTKQRKAPVEVVIEVQRQCREAGLSAPHPNTVRARISQISDRVRMQKRISSKAARERFEPLRGSFPDPEYPLAVVQIDHTPVDLILVDEVHRLPINKPHLTLAIDCFTRMIVGFYVSLEPPGAMTAGLCMAQAMLPKDTFLAKYGIASAWPIWGRIRKIYMDNAKEFHGVMLQRACKEHQITIEHRPRGIPNYGGTVERAFLTFMTKTHTLPGTTFSNVQDKGEYKSEAHASLTLREFEHWFTIFVVEVYHQRGHKGIADVPPIKAYEKAIMGTEGKPGIGLPMRFSNEDALRLDFTPYIERTIQEYGVLIDYIFYYSDALRPWVHARDPEHPKLKRKFIFARDPRDISVIYFFDPELRTYTPIPYRNAAHPPVSLWELRQVIRQIEEDPSDRPDEDLIFEAIRKMREIEAEAVAKTKHAKKARRNEERRKHAAASRVHGEVSKADQVPVLPAAALPGDYPGMDVRPFDDIVEAE